MNILDKLFETKPEPQPIPQASPRDYADITIVLDRSSSMEPLKQAVCDGLNSYIDKMREAPGANRWTLVQFDDPNTAIGANEPFPHTLFADKSEEQLPKISTLTSGSVASGFVGEVVQYRPRGSTALVSAVCIAMEQATLRTSGRQGVKHIMMVVTDGEENSSSGYTTAHLREQIGKWHTDGNEILYLGANQDAWTVANDYQMARQLTTNYAGACALSGAVVMNSLSRTASDFVPTYGGMVGAIGSGMVGLCHIASGHNFQINS